MVDLVDRLNAALGGRYVVEREIGQGGMATVYLATDLRHERQVALKVLRQELAATLGPERFLQEVRVTANLQHPHILPLFDSGEADGFLFYVMPYLEGESLRERLAREHELPVDEALRIIREVTDALATAHDRGVVHRDIKPDNVLITGRHAMVTDFGVAKAVSEATGRHQLTTAGVALGTPAYMAPEQAAADEHIDHRADIYAVGAMAYELLTGRPPFSGLSPQQMLTAHVTQAPRDVAELRPALSPALAAKVMRCLEKKPADRWQTAEELLHELEALGTPSGGLTPTAMRLLPPPRGWRVMAWTAAIAALAAVSVATVWALRPGAPATGPEGEPTALVELRQLTASPLETALTAAAISPEGNYVAFVDPSGLHVLIVETGERRTLDLPDGVLPWSVGWFADGTRLHFLARAESRSLDLWTIPLLGGVPRRVLRDVTWAEASPDGLKIAAIRSAGPQEQQFRQIWLVGPRGEDPRLLLEGAPDESFWQLAWAGNSQRLAFGVWGGRTAIESVDVESGDRSTLVTGRLFQSWTGVLPFTWCGDGLLVFSRQVTTVTSDVWTVETDPGRGEAVGEPVRRTRQTGQNVRQLSATSDCSRVVALMVRNQADVWLADLEDGGRRLANEIQLTVDERWDLPSSWSGDGETLFLSSSRTGNGDLYGVRPGSGGLEPKVLSPSTELYSAWDHEAGSLLYGARGNLYRALPDGGAGELVAEGPFRRVDCVPSRCVLSQADGDESVFRAVDPATGETRELTRMTTREPFEEWALSPDGSTVAVVHNDDDAVRLIDLDSGEERTLRVQGWAAFEFVDWTADGEGLFLNGGFAMAGIYPVLLHVDMDGNATVLRNRPNEWHVYPRASPDGRRLAFASMPFQGNAWILTGF